MAEGACASLACMACPKPGRCCSGFNLNSPDLARCETALDVLVWLATGFHRHEGGTVGPLPYLPLGIVGGTWRFWCPEMVEGRCAIHPTRPHTCSTFEPGSEPLCIMHRPDLVERDLLRARTAEIGGLWAQLSEEDRAWLADQRATKAPEPELAPPD